LHQKVHMFASEDPSLHSASEKKMPALDKPPRPDFGRLLWTAHNQGAHLETIYFSDNLAAPKLFKLW